MVKTSFSSFLPVKIWEHGIYKQKKICFTKKQGAFGEEKNQDAQK